MDVKRGMWSCYFDKTASSAIEELTNGARAYSIHTMWFFFCQLQLHWIMEDQASVCGEFSLASP
jgi:hypothetical protein